MVQADNPQGIKELIDKSLPEGAEAFGMQFEQLKSEYKTEETFRERFAYTKDKPVYVTNYRHAQNNGKTDEMLAEELIKFAEYGADLCDLMGDLFDKQPGELTLQKAAIDKQIKLIEKIHEKGAKVLMSSHVLKYIPAERVTEIALEHQNSYRCGHDGTAA